MTKKQEEDIRVQMARIEERVTADRKATSIHGKHINAELSEIKVMLHQHFADEEAQRLQFALVIAKIANYDENLNVVKDQIKSNKDSFYAYKTKMYLWEVFQEWKRVPFWSFMAIFAVVARREIGTLVNSLIDKFTGN